MSSNDVSPCIDSLYEGLLKLSRTTSVHQTLEHLCIHLEHCFQPKHLAFLLVEPKTGDLTFSLARGAKKTLLTGKRIYKGAGIAGWVAEEGTALLIKDTSTDPRFEDSFKSTKTQDAETIMAVPLISGGLVYGVFELFDTHSGDHYTEDSLAALSAIADLATMAIERAYYFQAMQRMSEADQLTGLPNQRVCVRYLEREVEICKRYGIPSSIMIFTVENLDHVYEEHGLVAADAIIKNLTTLMADTVRKVDMVCRIGPNKFGVLMPNTNALEAQVARLRLENKVKQQIVLHQLSEFHIASEVQTATRENMTPLLDIIARNPVTTHNFHFLAQLADNIADVVHEEKKFLEQRRYYRKEVLLAGTVINRETGVSADIVLESLSLTGAGFVTVFKSFLHKNDVIQVDFRLDDDRKTKISRLAQVRYIRGRYIGCQFTDQKSYNGDLGFYLMQ